MKHAMWGGTQVGGSSRVETWRRSLPQCLGAEGTPLPSRQVWGWRHAVWGITQTPRERDMIKMANLIVLLTHLSYLP